MLNRTYTVSVPVVFSFDIHESSSERALARAVKILKLYDPIAEDPTMLHGYYTAPYIVSGHYSTPRIILDRKNLQVQVTDVWPDGEAQADGVP